MTRLVAAITTAVLVTAAAADATPALDQRGAAGCAAVIALQTGSAGTAAARTLARHGGQQLRRSRVPGANAAARALSAATVPSKLAVASAWCARHPVTTLAASTPGFMQRTITGSGNQLVPVTEAGPAVVHITTANAAGRPFSVEAQDKRGDRTVLLANLLTAYDGVGPINLVRSAITTRLLPG